MGTIVGEEWAVGRDDPRQELVLSLFKQRHGLSLLLNDRTAPTPHLQALAPNRYSGRLARIALHL
jgi:hypothetical protein